MRIGIDIDDTLFDTNSCIIEEALKYDKEKFEGKGFKDESSYYLSEKFYWNQDMVNEFIDYFYHTGSLFNVLPKENASLITHKLHENGHKIFIITLRKRIGNIDVYTLTKEMLDRNNIYYDELYVGIEDKGAKCIHLNIDLFIDDLDNNCLSAIDSGVKHVINFGGNNDNFVCLDNWNDIYDYVRGIENE